MTNAHISIDNLVTLCGISIGYFNTLRGSIYVIDSAAVRNYIYNDYYEWCDSCILLNFSKEAK